MTEFDIPSFIRNLTQRPGVYCMLNADDKIIYVGKAKNLKNRVSSYFRARGLNTKTVALVSHIRRIEVTVTGSEAEALILEQTLIKKHRPQYNILLKDGKSYPYLHITNHAYPLLTYRRGRKRKSGLFFGPYPNSAAIRDSLNHLQKLFKLRSCEDSYFNHRSRPCLQYEIKRCSAPCVGHISQQEYQKDIDRATLFLNGKNRELIELVQADMESAAAQLKFERAAELRDQIDLMRRLQERQRVESGHHNADVWAIEEWQAVLCIQRLTFRGGRLTNSQGFFPNELEESRQELMVSFLNQFYLGGHSPDGLPDEIIAEIDTDSVLPLIDAIKLQSNKTIKHASSVRGDRKKWVAMAHDNARTGAQNRISGQQAASNKLEKVAELLHLDSKPNRVECFDISHSQGEATTASCVVYGSEGLDKKRYRRFNIKGVAAGDDYAALEQAVTRHLVRQIDNQDTPDLLLIDGGKGQINRINKVLGKLGLTSTALWGISKGTTRKSGWEYLWEPGNAQPIIPNAHNEGFRLLQHVRDESHRFAITGHRKERAKGRGQSDLESLPGVGPKRRRELLLHFGSLKNMRGAPVDELARVPGISQKLASQIFSHLHGED